MKYLFVSCTLAVVCINCGYTLAYGSCDICSSSFLSRKFSSGRRGCPNVKNEGKLNMLRNIDLPEALIFYGIDTLIQDKKRIRPGALRVIDEAKDLDIPTIVLSETHRMEEIARMLDTTDASKTFQSLNRENFLHYRSSREEYNIDADLGVGTDNDDGYDSFSPYSFVGRGIGYAPCPGALYDAIHTITIEPKGFGGSSGFGVKKWEATRVPLPQHCVVFVCSSSDKCDHEDTPIRNDGSGSISRDRCIASRYCGMRVIYIEDDGIPCTAEDIADGIVKTLGTEGDWEMVTIDDISTPGSFWLNMMQPKDEEGYTVQTETIIKEYIKRRSSNSDGREFSVDTSSQDNDEENLARILADIDPLV
mmetsp:Transcript_1803/g.3256  ORF Transcript_1803/g.3256 Transcript_1803/m.3256 type:complete len:363 (+) Transcript_1803:320-1408(+)